jgi:hypothetical protein
MMSLQPGQMLPSVLTTMEQEIIAGNIRSNDKSFGT